MIFQKGNTIRINEQIARASKGFVDVATAPIVFTEKDAKKVFSGVEKIKSMGAEEYAKLSKLTVKEIAKDWHDDDVKLAVINIAKAFKSINDAIHGMGQQNAALAGAAEYQLSNKEFHTNRGVNISRAIADIDTLNTALQETDVDAGYLLSYSPQDLRGFEEGRVTDLLGQVRFMELEPEEEPVLTPMSSMTSNTFGNKKFGGGFIADLWSMQHSLLSVNNFLSALRLASLRMRSHVGYKTLCIQDAKNIDQALIQKYTPLAGDDQARMQRWISLANARHTMNEMARDMIYAAAQIRKGDVTKRGNAGKKMSPLPVSVRTPLLVYFNAAHSEFIEEMLMLGMNDDGVTSPLLFNFSFIPSHLVPYSGAYKLGDKEQRDWEGAKGKVTEFGTTTDIGIRMVIPRNRNYFATMQDLEFGQETSFVKQKTTVAAYERYNFVVDQRQAARGVLGKV